MSSNLADALVVIAETFLAARIAAAPDPEIYQVIVHVGTDALPPDTPPASDRDNCRCRFPGCEARRVDLHHIRYWDNGGPTSLDNLLSLCPYHHQLVHDRGYLIAAQPGGTFAFYRPDGTPLPDSPPLPDPDGDLGDWHDAEITPYTIIPLWYGERLDLDYAIYTSFANAAYAENQARQQAADRPDHLAGARV